MMFGVVAALALVGCGPSKEDLQDQIDDAESRSSSLSDELDAATAKLEEANDRLDDAQQQLSTLQGAISDLQDEQRRFAYEDWQTVVRDIRDGIEGVSGHAAELDSRLQDVETSLDQ